MKMTRMMTITCSILAVVFLAPLAGMAGEFSLSPDDYQAAARIDEAKLASLVKNADVQPNWLDGGGGFWYRRENATGISIVIVDVSTGERSDAFDPALMTKALGELLGTDAEGPATSSPKSLRVEDGAVDIVYHHDGRQIVCSTDEAACRFGDVLSSQPDFLVAPGGEHTVFVRDHNLWLRDLADGSETQLTEDGEPYAAYGGGMDQQRLGKITADAGPDKSPQYSHWSPDGRFLLTRRLDERMIEDYPFLEAVPTDRSFRPRIHQVRVTLLGDENLPRVEHFIIDIQNRFTYPVQLPAGFDLDDPFPGNTPLGWSDDGLAAYLYVSSIDAQIGQLVKVDMRTGATQKILEERAPGSRVNLGSSFGPSVLVRIVGDEFIWYSERSNWGHLYLYDLATGELKRQLTSGASPINAVLHVDQSRRSVLVSKARDREGSDPYQQYVYRISLDGGDPVLLTPEEAHHVVTRDKVSVDGRYFIDTYSTISTPPRTVLRSIWDVADATLLEEADASELFDSGWRPPERIRVKAADGTTDLYAALFHPDERFRDQEKLPIIDANYINSIVAVAPVGFMDAVTTPWPTGFTQLGFFIVMVDGRGTPGRSREFREIGYPAFADIQIEDHVAAIRHLAEEYPRIDVDHVGIWGSSNGGAGAARAILKRPDFFKVAVASAGSHDYTSLPPSGIKFFGVPKYEDGESVRPAPSSIPDNYLPFDNAALAANLEGHLLLAYGDMDNLALPASTLRLANALIEAGKSFDLLYMPNRGHFLLFEPYFKRRLRHYFVEHLHGIRPPI